MNSIQPYSNLDFDMIVDQVVRGLSSDSSKRIYAGTYNRWIDWCDDNDIHPLHLSGDNIYVFIMSQDVSKSTRLNYLAHLRKMLTFLSIYHEGFDRFLKEASFLRIPETGSGEHRVKKALTPSDVIRILDSLDNTLKGQRDRVLLTLAFATGLRRQELADLTWDDIDLDAGLCHVRHGKGDKERQAAIVGDFAIELLQAWHDLSPAHLFPKINKADIIDHTKTIGVSGIYYVFREIEARTGIQVSPHAARRTLATELLLNGNMRTDVQHQLGHQRPSTTDIYAVAADATTRRKRLKTRW